MEEEAQPQVQARPHIDLESKGDNNIQKEPTQTKRGRRKGSSNSKITNAATTRASPRCTRSQAAPEWTVEETLVLVNEIASLDDDWLKVLPSNQRWKMISDNCLSMDVTRSSNQCKRRWDSLLSDYNKIRIWESNSASTFGSYWSLSPFKKKKFRLPVSFDQIVFGSMDAVVKAQEAPIDSQDLVDFPQKTAKDDSDDDSEDMFDANASDSDYDIALPKVKCQAEEIIDMLEAEMAAADADSEETGTKNIKSTNNEDETLKNLRQCTEEIHAILRGELPDDVSKSRGPVDSTKPDAVETEFTRRQADELIKAFGVLAGSLDQFRELIKDAGCD